MVIDTPSFQFRFGYAIVLLTEDILKALIRNKLVNIVVVAIVCYKEYGFESIAIY